MTEPDIVKTLTAAADQCVKCGLCLPHCPTYRELRDEAESPRGRIALIQGWTEGHIADSPKLRRHLENCLECRACETVCPSLVRFGDIMDGARALSARLSPAPKRMAQRAWLDGLSSTHGARAAALLSSLYRTTGLARLAEWTGVVRLSTGFAIHRLALQLKRMPQTALADGTGFGSRPKLTLFLGCVARSAQPHALEAALLVLRRLGFQVEIPENQGCCGAMHRHNGFPQQADRLLAANADALGAAPAVGIASACVAELRTRSELAESHDICRLLADLDWPDQAGLTPLSSRIAVHEPCSQRNMLRDGRAAYDLLRRIPDIELLPLPDNSFCCGAAGTYLLQRPEMSQTLLRPKLDQLSALGVDTLVTTNTGCALHLAAGIREARLSIEVLHPVELIARQLSCADDSSGPTPHGC